MSERIPTVVVIPTRYQGRMLVSMLGAILSDNCVDKVLIYDNGADKSYTKILYDLKCDKIMIYDAPDLSVYQMWNRGWKWAKEHYDKVNIAILNDDVFFWYS